MTLRAVGRHRWAITIHIDPSMRGGAWNSGIRIGRKVHVVPLHVAP